MESVCGVCASRQSEIEESDRTRVIELEFNWKSSFFILHVIFDTIMETGGNVDMSCIGFEERPEWFYIW